MEDMLKKRRLKLAVKYGALVVLSFFFTGCWDRIEIENRGFVLGMAIDHVETQAPEGQYDLLQTTHSGKRKYHIAFELPKFRKQAPETSTGPTEEEHYIFSGDGESISAVARAIDAKTYFTLFFEDIRTVVFSESVAREGIGGFLDYFLRNPDVRQRVNLFVTPGRAEDILKNKLQVAEVNSNFIARITRNEKKAPYFVSRSNFSNVITAALTDRPFALSQVVMENGDVKLTKAVLFNKEKKMVGEMDEWEVVGAKIISRVIRTGVFSLPNPADPNKLIVFELQEENIKIESHLEGGRLWFTLKANFIGNIIENAMPERDALDPEFQKAGERAAADLFTRQVFAAYRKSQELKVDTVGLGELVYRQHPEYWKTVKDRWDDEIFPTVPLEVDIKVVIRRTGMLS